MNEDLSNLFEKFNINKDNISPEMINNLMDMLNNNSSSNNDQEAKSNSPNSGFDFDTILKMKSIIDKMNVQNDPRSNLLYSLKPYLNENRKSKIDQYVQLMNISRAMEIFPFFGGENNNAKQ